MKSKIMKLIVICLTFASLCMGRENGDGRQSKVVKDADGNEYFTTKIGNQIWMAKNLNVDVDGSMCYDNNPANCEKYGRLYTWKAAQSVCPAGWHLPSKEELDVFVEYVEYVEESMADVSSHLRDRSWNNGFDSFGFSALPAGYYDSDDKEFGRLGDGATFWSSTEDGSDRAAILFFAGDRRFGVSNNSKYNGRSVRCLQD